MWNDLDFDKWMVRVDEHLIELCGLKSDDLADCRYAEWYEEGESPSKAARKAMRAQYGGRAMETRTLAQIEAAARLDTLERMIDQATLAQVLEAVSIICCDKADHIRENWQPLGMGDKVQANSWERLGTRLDRAASDAREVGI